MNEFMRNCQIVERTGLSADYGNAWGKVSFALARVERGEPVKPELVTICTYENYLRAHSRSTADKILAEARPGRIKALDELAIQFNALPISDRLKRETAKCYMDKMSAIILGAD